MKFFAFVAALIVLIGPVFAVGNLTVTGIDLVPVSNYTNSNTSVELLNLSLKVTTETGSRIVTVSMINVSLGNGSTTGNVSSVELYLGNDTTVIGRSSTGANATTFNVSITNTLVVNSTSNATVIVRFNMSRNATTRQLLSAIVASASDIGVDSAGSNVTLSTIQSNTTQLQDIHANVSIGPSFVDTGAINQTLVYTIVPTGKDGINRTIISIPSGYNFTNISTVQVDGSNTTGGVTVTTSPSYINVTMTTPTTQTIKVSFNVNTSGSAVSSTAFTSTIDGGNRTGMATDLTGANSTNITTQQLITVIGVALAKGAAIVNGTDYWEFNFTLNFTATATGLVQFKMSNWVDTSSTPNTLYLNTSSAYYATLRNNSGNFSDPNGNFNVTNSYGDNTGISQSASQGGNLPLVMRMIIPSGTAVSSTWAATYNFLFRTTP